MESRRAFAINWDYRCPFARNAHEHVLDGLAGGAPWDVTFVPFFLNQAHVPEGGPAAWDDPAAQADLLALASGVVVKERSPEQFSVAHRRLFDLRHDEGGDLRNRETVRSALAQVGVDPDAVLAEVDAGWPAKMIRDEHEEAVGSRRVFGVPTFTVGDRSVFVRLMSRPGGDAALAKDTVERVLDMIEGHPEINEFKHTEISR